MSTSRVKKARDICAISTCYGPYPKRNPLRLLNSKTSLFSMFSMSATTCRMSLRLQRTISLRDEGAFIALSRPGRLTIFNAKFGARPTRNPRPHIREARPQDANSRALIPHLALNPPAGGTVHAVHQFLFNLLNKTVDRLEKVKISSQDALSLVGRALFFRFLLDRHLLDGAVEPSAICKGARSFSECFDTPIRATRTSNWLDEIFNGDLLPLSKHDTASWFGALPEETRDKICHELGNIAHGATSDGQLRLPSDWADINFAHVPVGLLSQVYESHCHRVAQQKAKKESIYYTPRTIAEYMVKHAFTELDHAHKARVLDPAAGAGVFLVTAFRHLVALRWAADDKRPTRRVIRSILAQQLTGFDINESALRLTGLGLYLTALELDPSPQPLSDLKFANLRGTVLHDVSHNRTENNFTLGSLAPVADAHRGKYDVVIGNPPWTAISEEDGGSELRRHWLQGSERIAQERLEPSRPETLDFPDNAPDLPFFYRAMEWACDRGRIAFAVHARLLFKQSDGGFEARRNLFEAVHVTGVLNGSALRLTKVWPNVTAPFCLVFADNEKSSPTDAFYFVSPELEGALNKKGRMRVDASAAQAITVEQVATIPPLLKTRFRGTELDVAVMRKIESPGTIPLDDYWGEKHLNLQSGKGFIVSADNEHQEDASELHIYRRLDRIEPGIFRVRVESLDHFTAATLHRRRPLAQYKGPLVLVKRSRKSVEEGGAVLCEKGVAYRENFMGYSCHGHSEAPLLARYLLLVLNSQLPFYYSLMTSSQFGIERDALLKVDLEQFPMVPFAKLSSQSRQAILPLSAVLLEGENIPWDKIEDWAAKLYGLTRDQREVIRDTLSVGQPYPEFKKRAGGPPTDTARAEFVRRLKAEIDTLIEPLKKQVSIQQHPWNNKSHSPWIFLQLDSLPPNRTPPPLEDLNVPEFLRIADEQGASQIILETEKPGSLQLGILAHGRYWTLSRARLCAMDLFYDHEFALLGGRK